MYYLFLPTIVHPCSKFVMLFIIPFLHSFKLKIILLYNANIFIFSLLSTQSSVFIDKYVVHSYKQNNIINAEVSKLPISSGSR